MITNSVTNMFCFFCYLFGFGLSCCAARVSKILEVKTHVALSLFLLKLLCVGRKKLNRQRKLQYTPYYVYVSSHSKHACYLAALS